MKYWHNWNWNIFKLTYIHNIFIHFKRSIRYILELLNSFPIIVVCFLRRNVHRNFYLNHFNWNVVIIAYLTTPFTIYVILYSAVDLFEIGSTYTSCVCMCEFITTKIFSRLKRSDLFRAIGLLPGNLPDRRFMASFTRLLYARYCRSSRMQSRARYVFPRRHRYVHLHSIAFISRAPINCSMQRGRQPRRTNYFEEIVLE